MGQRKTVVEKNEHPSWAPAKTCSIPPLKNASNEWVLDAAAKATLIAETQLRKCTLGDAKQNSYSKIQRTDHQQEFLEMPTTEMAYKELNELKETSATGADLLPARILK